MHEEIGKLPLEIVATGVIVKTNIKITILIPWQ